MSTNLSFNDGAAATLKNGAPVPGDRFSNWVPISRPIGDAATVQATGAIAMFVLRTDYGATFELTQIPVVTTGGVRLVDIAARLILHLMKGGTCSVITGDADTNVYATCGLM